MQNPKPSLEDLSRASWDANASYWDSYRGEAQDAFYLMLEEPVLDSYCELEADKRTLELGAGSGQWARHAASRGSLVVVTDASEQMLERAKDRGNVDGRLDFARLDVTVDADLQAFANEHGVFDNVVINMVLMDIPRIDVLARNLGLLVKPNGVVAVTVLHPAFFSAGASRSIDFRLDQATGRFERMYSVKVEKYLDTGPSMGRGLQYQPESQVYFHRSLHELLGPFLSSGFLLDKLDELSLKDMPKRARGEFSWENWADQIPQILAFRLRHNSTGVVRE